MKVYGSELRQAALRALEAGQKRQAVALMLGVSVPTLDRWRREHRQSGQVAPRPRGHKRCAFGTRESELLQELLRQAPDATLEQHLQAWRAQTGQSASRASLARAIVRLGWTRKKRA
jgi:transposase